MPNDNQFSCAGARKVSSVIRMTDLEACAGEMGFAAAAACIRSWNTMTKPFAFLGLIVMPGMLPGTAFT
jgi:hypothetical protein